MAKKRPNFKARPGFYALYSSYRGVVNISGFLPFAEIL
jgi:hypothetical protein